MDREKWPVKWSKKFNPKVLSKTLQVKGWQLFYDVSLLESKPLSLYYESSIPSGIGICIFHRLFYKSNDNCPCRLWINMSQEQCPTIKTYHFKIDRKLLTSWTLKSFLYRRKIFYEKMNSFTYLIYRLYVFEFANFQIPLFM